MGDRRNAVRRRHPPGQGVDEALRRTGATYKETDSSGDPENLQWIAREYLDHVKKVQRRKERIWGAVLGFVVGSGLLILLNKLSALMAIAHVHSR